MEVPVIPGDPFIAVSLARAANTDAGVLAELTLSPLPFVREAALSNAATPLSAIAAAAPRALHTEAEIGVARSIASRPDAPPALLEGLIALLTPFTLDGSRRENWPHEQLAVALLNHSNLPDHVRVSFRSSVKVSKPIRSALPTAVCPSSQDSRDRSGA